MNKISSLISKWMLTPLEVVLTAAVILFIGSGLYFSIRDALQLEQALNLNLTQTLIVFQGIVNLQREVQLTRGEVLRQLGKLDTPPKPITRFDFAEIQVNNLTLEAQAPANDYSFANDAITLIHEIKDEATAVEKNLADLKHTTTESQKAHILANLDMQLQQMEATIKELVDIQSTAQREAIIQSRDSLSASQSTTFITVFLVLSLSIALALVFRTSLTIRLQQAVESEKLKGQFLANVSHELRTPISAIQGYAQLLSEEAYGPLTEKQQTTIQRVLINTTQLKGMVNNLLDSAQIEQGKLSIRNKSFSPAELLESAHAALNILAATKGLKLTGEVTPDVPAAITGDFLRLQQILFNLISNAIKFTEHGGVHTKIFLPDATHWALEVTDTGIGISPEHQSQIFSAFWQVDSSATREYRGSGLGLSIIRQLCNLMGGEVTLTSEVGKGSKFTITLPLETHHG